MNISALGSVYAGEEPGNLRESLDSLRTQQRLPDEVVLVLDGPVPDEMERVVASYAKALPLRTVRLEVNVGLGRALNAGLRQCRGDLVARFDSDDINLPERLATQEQLFMTDPSLDICSSYVSEFVGASSSPDRHVRAVPLDHDSIARWAWLRNPFNHPAVMFRRVAAMKWNGYVDHAHFEDFLTWQKWISHGARTANLPKALVRMRTSQSFYERRGTLKYAGKELQALRFMFQSGLIGPWQFTALLLVRVPVRLIPTRFRRLAYRLLRKDATSPGLS